MTRIGSSQPKVASVPSSTAVGREAALGDSLGTPRTTDEVSAEAAARAAMLIGGELRAGVLTSSEVKLVESLDPRSKSALDRAVVAGVEVLNSKGTNAAAVGDAKTALDDAKRGVGPNELGNLERLAAKLMIEQQSTELQSLENTLRAQKALLERMQNYQTGLEGALDKAGAGGGKGVAEVEFFDFKAGEDGKVEEMHQAAHAGGEGTKKGEGADSTSGRETHSADQIRAEMRQTTDQIKGLQDNIAKLEKGQGGDTRSAEDKAREARLLMALLGIDGNEPKIAETEPRKETEKISGDGAAVPGTPGASIKTTGTVASRGK